MGMKEYTEWWVKYPWHVSDIPAPNDCGCKYRKKKRRTLAKAEAKND